MFEISVSFIFEQNKGILNIDYISYCIQYRNQPSHKTMRMSEEASYEHSNYVQTQQNSIVVKIRMQIFT